MSNQILAMILFKNKVKKTPDRSGNMRNIDKTCSSERYSLCAHLEKKKKILKEGYFNKKENCKCIPLQIKVVGNACRWAQNNIP